MKCDSGESDVAIACPSRLLDCICTNCTYMIRTGFEWDPRKAAANFTKHRVRFAEALVVFEDDRALTVKDDESDPEEERFVSVGTGATGRVLVVVYTYRRKNIRIISARVAEPRERKQYEEER
jgi:uncharacterized DUF497 family protein